MLSNEPILPKPGAQNPSKLRYAPSFKLASAGSAEAPPYTAETIHKYLGFADEKGLHRINDTLNGLALIETGVLRNSERNEPAKTGRWVGASVTGQLI